MERSKLQERDRRNRNVMLALTGLVAMMIGLAYASVPLYRLFCAVTGYQGTPKIATTDSSQVVDRYVTVRFTADIAAGLGWRFQPQQREMRVQVGKSYLAFYEAENLESKPVTGRATYNISPDPFAPYFTKTACFCFNEQTLKPGQKVVMPVSFYIDADMVKDTQLSKMDDVTLSYTFFRAAEQNPNGTTTLGAATGTLGQSSGTAPATSGGNSVTGNSQKSSLN
jgi:cytochrome c oxidase assembly protein subunit 11